MMLKGLDTFQYYDLKPDHWKQNSWATKLTDEETPKIKQNGPENTQLKDTP